MNQLIKYTFLCLSTLFVAISCDTNLSDTSSSDATSETSSPVTFDQQIVVDSINSVVTWIGSRPGKKHDGIIEIKNGKIGLKADEIVSGEIVIDISTLEIKDLPANNKDQGTLTRHLLSEAFFHADSFPTATFSMTKFQTLDSSLIKGSFEEQELLGEMVINPTHFISGNLTIKGIRKNITVPARVTNSQNQIKVEARFDVNRQDWGIATREDASLSDRAIDQLIFDTLNLGFYIVTTSVSK